MKWLDTDERGGSPLVVSDETDVRALLSIDQRIIDRNLIKREVHKNGLLIRGQNNIGMIPISHDLGIRVRPKVPVSRIARMLSLISQDIVELPFGLADISSTDDDYDLSKTITRSFCDHLPTLVQKGPIRQYRKIRSISPGARGKIDVYGTINGPWARGRYDYLSSEFYEFDYSNYLNQALKFAIQYLIDTMEEPRNNFQRQMNILVESRMILDSVPDAPPHRFLPQLRDHLMINVPDEPYHSFRPLLKLALLIASGETPDVAGDARGVQYSLPPLVLDMAKTFEQFCIAIFNTSLGDTSFELKDTSSESNTPLLHPPVEYNDFWKCVRATESAHPDFVIQQRNKNLLIGEVKYANSPSSSHIHQVCAHAAAFDCNTVLLIYPSKIQLTNPQLEMLGFLGKKRVFRLWISIDFTSLNKLTQSLNRIVVALLSSQQSLKNEVSKSN